MNTPEKPEKGKEVNMDTDFWSKREQGNIQRVSPPTEEMKVMAVAPENEVMADAS